MNNKKNRTSFAAIALFSLACGPALCADTVTPPTTVLARSGPVAVTAEDYEASLQRIPESDRFGFAMSQDRVNKEVENILRIRMLAEAARKAGNNPEQMIKARVKQYEERLLAEALVARIDVESAREFEAKQASYVERARELYLVDKKQFQKAGEVKASHILVQLGGRPEAEALAKAKALRARIVAGEKFETIAEQESNDATAKQNKGELGYFGPGVMDRAFETAAFSMTTPGELSEPVRSQFGYHIIRFEDRKPPVQMSFEEAKPNLMEKLKGQFIETRRAQRMSEIYDRSKVEWNEPAVAGLKKSIDPALLKSIDK